MNAIPTECTFLTSGLHQCTFDTADRSYVIRAKKSRQIVDRGTVKVNDCMDARLAAKLVATFEMADERERAAERRLKIVADELAMS